VKWLNLAWMLSCYASFLWAVVKFFARADKVGGGMRAISAVGALNMIVSAGLLFRLSEEQVEWQAVATVCFVLSLGVFWWTVRTNWKRPLTLAYTPDAPEHFVSSGPYHWVRHPFYLSYMFAWLGATAAAQEVWLLVPAAVLFALYWDAAVKEEKKFSESKFSADYQCYQESTGRFFPKLF